MNGMRKMILGLKILKINIRYRISKKMSVIQKEKWLNKQVKHLKRVYIMINKMKTNNLQKKKRKIVLTLIVLHVKITEPFERKQCVSLKIIKKWLT